MRAAFAYALGCATCVVASRFSSLPARQVDGNVEASVFLRRGYHSSELPGIQASQRFTQANKTLAVVLDNWLYIDGGEVSYSSGSGVTYQYSNDLLALDLSQNFTNSSLPYKSIAKPTGVPNLVGGGLWVDTQGKTLYTGFAGTPSVFGDQAPQDKGLWSFAADGKGSGQWTNLNSSADKIFTDTERPYNGETVSVPGIGLFMGGQSAFALRAERGSLDVSHG
jgi:hypothetical protein